MPPFDTGFRPSVRSIPASAKITRVHPRHLPLALLLFFTPLQANDWPQFRGPSGTGIGATDAPLPASFGPDENVLWSTPLPPGDSSPILTADTIYLTAVEDDHLYTYALDRETGEIRWRRQAPRPRQENFRATHGPASPTPVTDGENVYVFFGDFGLLSYGADGEERWRLPLGPFDNVNGHGTSPIYYDGRVYLVCDGDSYSYLLAADAQTGKLAFVTERPGITRGYATPGIFRPGKPDHQVIVPGAFYTVAYHPQSGEEIWRVSGMAWQLKAVPLFHGEDIIINSWESGGGRAALAKIPTFDEFLAANDKNGDGLISPAEHPNPRLRDPSAPGWVDNDLNDDGLFSRADWDYQRARRSSESSLLAIRPGSATGDITNSHVRWRHYKSLPNTPSPLLYRDTLFLVKDGGIVTSLDPSTGEVHKAGRLESLEKYWASPVAAGGEWYALSEDCSLSRVSAKPDWTLTVTIQFEGRCLATPAVTGGSLYLRTNEQLWRLGTR